MAPKTAQDRTKTGPRSSWIAFFASSIFASIWDRFRVRFGAVLGAKMEPRGRAYTRQIDPLGVQDPLGIDLARFSCRLVVRGRFFGRLRVVLGSFLGAPGVVLVLFRPFNSSIQPVNSSTRRFNASTHQLINSSSHGPSALSYPARRTARCAIK